MSDYHTPVLLSETIIGLDVVAGKRYIDATIGGGGHSTEIVRRGGILLGLDTDEEAVNYSTERLKTEGGNWKIVQGNFRDIEAIAKENGFETVHGILFDLGVSSHQIDTGERGFSYRFDDAPLDLRLDQTRGESARERIARSTEEDLYEIFSTFGEEELARPIARALVSARRVSPVETVGTLKTIIKSVIKDTHQQAAVLSRIFQALRIAVNDELGALKSGLIGARNLIEPGGRLVVISFHSLEDRIVKRFMRETEWNMITKRPRIASEDERRQNVRSRSAKLRIAQKII